MQQLTRRMKILLRRSSQRFLRLDLRTRVASAMLMLVSIAAILVAVIAHFAGERLEENVNYDLLAEELTHYEQRLRIDPSAAPLMSASLHIYRSINLAELPREIANLRPGVHRTVRRDGRSFRVLVRDGEFGRLYITYDVTDHERGQRIALLVLVIGVASILVLTTWAAFSISRPLLAPVDRLAKQLSDIDPGQRSIRIADQFTGNELEPIARSIDSFMERLDGFVEREQAFTSTASHELRTPLAVIQGAVEILMEQHTAPAAQKALARIERAVREMAEFTTALLSLARESHSEHGAHSACNITTLLPRIIDDQTAAIPNRTLQVEIDQAQPLHVRAPDSMVAMVIGNIVRNALQHSASESVQVALKERTLTVINEGGIAAQDVARVFEPRFTTRRGGHGMGLYIARRICDRYGWNISIDSAEQQTIARVTFSTAN